MKLLGLDIETGSSFDVPQEQMAITEIGAVLWDTDLGMPVKIFSELINEGQEVCQEASEYTHITTEMIREYGLPPANVQGYMEYLVQQADYIVAHNGRFFDGPVLSHFFARYQMNTILEKFQKTKIIDTQYDIEYPWTVKQRSLPYLAAVHKILNSFPHRAVTDVLTMMEVLNHYDLDRIVQIVESPIRLCKAGVDKTTKDWAKNRKFRYDPETYTWSKEIREIHLEEGIHKDWEFVLSDLNTGEVIPKDFKSANSISQGHTVNTAP